ncbi:hypothetical protein E4U41_003438 [Claviceps citrina]|nr:hypothetical protein E4U41_003438 [Claviceps citrina]
MGHKWKRYRSSPVTEPGIDLLSTAFGLPSRWDIKREDQKLRDGLVFQYETGSDDTIDSMLESDTEDAHTPHETSPSNRSATPKTRRSIFSSTRKRQQAHRHTSSADNKRNGPKKGVGDALSVKAAFKEQQSKQTRSPSKSRERSKISKPAPPGSCSPRLAKSQNASKNDGRSHATFPPPPLMVNPVYQDTEPNLSTHSRFAPFQTHLVPLMAQSPGNFGHRFAYHPACPAINGKSQQGASPLPNSATHKLPGLQQRLNDAQDRLSREPGNLRLQRELSDAQQQLNEFMDALVAERSQRDLHSSITLMKEGPSKEQYSPKDDAKENVAPVEKSTKLGNGVPFSPQQQADQTLRLAVLKRAGISNTIRHHLCSGCGDVRSRHFHGIHPVGMTHKPMLNYCSACRELRFNKNMMDSHHFCFGCGKVRSKIFHDKYRAEPGGPLLPNYCGNCTNEVRLMEDNNEASIVGAVSFLATGAEDRKSGVASDSPTAPANRVDSSQRPIMQAPKKAGRARKIAQLRLSNTSPIKSAPSPVSPAESSPFYPGRRLGSAQRRAQRGATPHAGEENVAASGDSARTHGYRIPYVEEISSETDSGEPEVQGSNKTPLHVEAKSTRRRESRTEDGGQTVCTKNGQSSVPDETPGPDKCRHLPDVATSISSEGTTLKPPPQCQAGYDGLGSRSRQFRSTFRPDCPAHEEEESTRSRGVFGKGNRHGGEARFENPNETRSRRPSPLADFEYPNHAPYFHADDSRDAIARDYADQPETSQFSSSRGAFGRKESSFSMFDYTGVGSAHSGLNSLDGSGSHDTCKNHDPQQADGTRYFSSDQDESEDSSYLSNSSSSKAASGNDRPPTDNNTYSRSVFTSFSRSTNNPYYNPRRRQYPTSSDGAFRSSWEWSNRKQPPTTSRANGGTGVDDRIPEPIVEEPVSPPSSPVQRTMLLGKFLEIARHSNFRK